MLGNESEIKLFGIWQTIPFRNELDSNGDLPKNEYGNYELFNGPNPEGTVHINLPGVSKLCKENKIRYLEAISGYENKKNGRPHVVKSGILAFKNDEFRIFKLYTSFYKEFEQKRSLSLKQSIISCWKQLFKAIVLKKHLNEKYD